MEDNATTKTELLVATRELSERGLVYSAKWCAEQALAIKPDLISNIKPSATIEQAKQDIEESDIYLLAKTYFDIKEYYRVGSLLSKCKGQKCIFLKLYSLFLGGEKRKEEQIEEVQNIDQSNIQNQQEKETDYQNNQNLVQNIELPNISDELSLLDSTLEEGLDSFNLYLYALVLSCQLSSKSNKGTLSNIDTQQLEKDLQNTNQDIESSIPKNGKDSKIGTHNLCLKLLSRSVSLYPFNWSAWGLLTKLPQNQQDITNITNYIKYYSKSNQNYNSGLFFDFWIADVLLSFQNSQQSISHYDSLEHMFLSEDQKKMSLQNSEDENLKNENGSDDQNNDNNNNNNNQNQNQNIVLSKSNHILTQKAIANYNLREFSLGCIYFSCLIERDKYNLDNLDVYSNILYVQEDLSSLSHLAHKATIIDKYRPQTCSIIGNYYSLKSEHQKAVIYFQRALALNSNYLSAWTLMGHEYVELKNTSAAIYAYRKAVDIDSRDYRAWYGLGQTYQLLKMYLYALYYYRKAAILKPYDARMWNALAGCYESLDRVPNAIQAYERALQNNDTEIIASNKLAKLYSSQGNNDTAAYYYKKNLESKQFDQSQETIQALLFLATHCKNIGSLSEAEKYCSTLLDFPGKEKEEAKALLRSMRNFKN